MPTTKRQCQNCKHCGWEPDSDLYCGHPKAFEEVSCFGASLQAMGRLGLCDTRMQLWEPRK